MKHKVLILMFILTLALIASGCSKISLQNISDDIKKTSELDASKDYILSSDVNIITEIDLSRLNETELKYAYEEIFARHGKVFEDANLSKYFNSKDWYTPDPSYSEDDLSDVEKENKKYISDYINQHFSTTEITTAGNTASAGNNKNTVVVVHDEPYYYEHYWGDNTFIFPESSTVKLSREDLEGFDSDTLALIRNEIYARNGYVFQKEKYRDYFGSKLWYSPNPNFNESWLNETEKYNIQLIKSLE